jgi:hypothetical protein
MTKLVLGQVFNKFLGFLLRIILSYERNFVPSRYIYLTYVLLISTVFFSHFSIFDTIGGEET